MKYERAESAGQLALGRAGLWVVTTDKTGHVNQCIALTDALGVTPDRFERIPGFNLRDAAPTKLVRRMQGIIRSLKLLWRTPRHPVILVTSGRSSGYGAKLLRWRLGARLFVIFIGVPRRFPKYVDLAIMDEASSPSWRREAERPGVSYDIIPICGVLARRFDATSARARGCRDRPLIAVFIGGENKHFDLADGRFRHEMLRLRDLAQSGEADVEVVLSRRTSELSETIIRDVLGGGPAIVHNREASSRYRELLQKADILVVTPDSYTMMSEACLTGKLTFVPELTSLPDSNGGGQRIVEAMRARGAVRRFDGRIDYSPPAEPLDEAARIVPVIAEYVMKWRSSIE